MITVAVLTISDSTADGTREDISGPAVAAHTAKLGWTVVERAVVSDDEDDIAEQLQTWIDSGIALILTTGGTGISARDVTPEATLSVIEKELPGIGELMRAKGLAQTELSILSRGVAGSSRSTFIVNLPGSPTGAVFSLQAIEGVIPHAIRLLQGQTWH